MSIFLPKTLNVNLAVATLHAFPKCRFNLAPALSPNSWNAWTTTPRPIHPHDTPTALFKINAGGRDEGNVEPLVQERVSNDLVRRFWLDEHSGDLRVEEVNINGFNGSNGAWKESNTDAPLSLFGFFIPKVVTDFFLPAGFPDSVSADYLQYMLWQFPTNVTGWICSTLVTSSLFKAVGIGVGGGYAAAAAATIKWVTKDGLGAIGLILIGGRFGSIFDEDPKQWRMYADVIGSAGSIFELCTPLAPDMFLPLASLGHLTKAVAKGLKDPSFRVIQNHFAISENVGDVSAKEEVWEVSAELVGLAFGVLLLSMPALSDSYWKLVAIWASLRSLHLWLRYQSLAVVQFSTINYRRAAVLVEAHIQGYPIPDCEECNSKEEFLIWQQLMTPRIWIGCSLKDVLGSSLSPLEFKELQQIYASEGYVLVLHQSSSSRIEARVLVKEGATNISILRSLWQAYWLLSPSVAECRSLSSSINSEILRESTIRTACSRVEVLKLTTSLEAMDHHFKLFLTELKEAGWDLDKIILKVPSKSPALIL